MQTEVEIAREFAHDLVLQRKNFTHLSVNLDRLDDLAGFDFDQTGSNAQLVSQALITAPDDPSRADLLSDASREFFVEIGPQVFMPMAKRFENPFAPDNSDAFNGLQIGSDCLGDAYTQPLIFRSPGHIIETKDRDALPNSSAHRTGSNTLRRRWQHLRLIADVGFVADCE